MRLAAWRAVWAALPNNAVLAARFTHLTTREHNRLARQQARAACAAAVLRWLHVVVDRTREAHVRQIFVKLDLPPSVDDHRRVLAVLMHLQSQAS